MSTFTLVHVVVSAMAVLLGLLRVKRLDGWNSIFLITIVLTIVAAIKFRPEALVAAT
jgi:hypothetical protein